MSPTILFICTGNYYRSRFAEELFNALASKLGLDWRAVSRGLDTERGANIGPISSHALKKLKMLDIPVEANLRGPLQLGKSDLLEANLIIALDAEEHKPLMARQFAEWADRTMYWHVPDLHLMKAEDALSGIESNVSLLVQELSSRISLSEQGSSIKK
jgi:protein-tyrosine phosphatase